MNGSLLNGIGRRDDIDTIWNNCGLGDWNGTQYYICS